MFLLSVKKRTKKNSSICRKGGDDNEKRHVMRALVAAATALALTACGSAGSSDASKSTSTAASHHVPVLFLSGDEEICRQAKELIPGITTVETKHGVGAATWCKAKGKAISEIREGVKKAVAGQKKECQVALPEHFTYEVTYKDWKKRTRCRLIRECRR